MPNRRIKNQQLRRSRTLGRNHNSVNYVSAIKLGPVTHTILVALMITVLGLIYLTQATQATGFDYQAQKIENQIAELSIQKDNLEVENARLTAMQTVKSSTVAAKLSEPKTFEYAN